MREKDDMPLQGHRPAGRVEAFVLIERAVLPEQRVGNGRARRGYAAAAREVAGVKAAGVVVSGMVSSMQSFGVFSYQALPIKDGGLRWIQAGLIVWLRRIPMIEKTK
jgi:hypothetical protein